MNFYEALQQYEKGHPKRRPDSTAAHAILATIKELTADWEFGAQVKKIPVFHFSVSVMVYTIGSILAVFLSFWHSFSGLIFEIILFLLLVNDLRYPILARVRPNRAENLSLTIPARSKETQRIIFATSYSTDSFAARFLQLPNRIFLGIIYGLALIIVLLLGSNLFLNLQLLLFIAFLAILGIIVLNLTSKEADCTTGLVNCSILLELGAILLKTRSSSTSVTFFFSGANSLNSGFLEIPKYLKGSTKLNYVVNLIEWADKRINLVAADGLLLPQQSDSLLMETLMEVAKEKSIPLQTIKLSEISPAFALKLQKLKVISVTNPQGIPEVAKNLRELLIGLIRKLDR